MKLSKEFPTVVVTAILMTLFELWMWAWYMSTNAPMGTTPAIWPAHLVWALYQPANLLFVWVSPLSAIQNIAVVGIYHGGALCLAWQLATLACRLSSRGSKSRQGAPTHQLSC